MICGSNIIYVWPTLVYSKYRKRVLSTGWQLHGGEKCSLAKPEWVERSVSKQKIIVLGADLNEHVGEENMGDEEIMGRYVAGTRNKEESMVVDRG